MKLAFRSLLPLALVFGIPGVPATAGGGLLPDGPGLESEGDIVHVANVSYGGGSDLEFATKTVRVLDENGEPVCARDERGECVRDANGDVVYETEERDYAFAGRLSQPVQVIDITDPAKPVRVAEVPCRFNQNDVQVFGDTLLMAADASGPCTMANGATTNGAGFATADISDPRFPRVIGRANQPGGAHTLTVHPSRPLVYVSNGDISVNGSIHIWSIANPANPVKVRDWAPQGAVEPPHDITFNATGTRAYSAAQDAHTFILDTTDPQNPSTISVIVNEGISYSHQADPTPDGKYLLIGDELGGGAATLPSPGGPVHVYDIRNEQRPVKVGVIGTDATGVNGVSTAHVFRINPDGWTMAIGWYRDGVHVWDFSDIRGVGVYGSGAATGVGSRTIGWMRMPNANTWAAKMWQERHPGYVFANDQGRGFDVFYVPSLGPGFVGTGRIRTGQIADTSQTEREFLADCDHSPATQGLDAWVAKLPPGTGGAELRASGTAAALSVRFLTASCQPLGITRALPAAVPGGAAYAVVTMAAGSVQQRFVLSAA